VTGDLNARNRASRERLDVVIQRLGDRVIEIDGGWTASALLAHIAFWDRLAAVRLEKYVRDGEPPVTAPPALSDLTNGAGMRQWRDLAPAVAAMQARDAAAAMDRLVESLSPDKLAALKAFDRPQLYDRADHRKQHLDQIERALR
jgi:hypothetical protein